MANKYKEIKTMAEVLEEVDNYIESKIRDYEYDYTVVGEEQAKNWCGELQWMDEEKTEPKMVNKWDYVKKDEIYDEDKTKIEALRKIQKHLEKMI